MLTIGQLAAHAGVTVRAVRHYHAKGLLPEPDRDHSGYRRYDAQAVVELIRIRTLAEAGVPLARVSALLTAGEEDFAAAVDDIDRRLRSEIRERQRHRERIAQLAAGDSLALPPEAVAYFDRVRELGLRERFVEVERDSWILLAAQVPDAVPVLMAAKHAQLSDPEILSFYRDLDGAVDLSPDDPGVVELADRVVAQLDRLYLAAADDPQPVGEEHDLDPGLVALLDEAFLESFPVAARLLELLEERGWSGWTMIRRREDRR